MNDENTENFIIGKLETRKKVKRKLQKKDEDQRKLEGEKPRKKLEIRMTNGKLKIQKPGKK